MNQWQNSIAMSWFSRAFAPAPPQNRVALGPPWATEEDPYGESNETRLLRRPARWEVSDAARGASLGGAGEAFLSLQRLRLAVPGGGSAQIPLRCVSNERFEQPVFGCNYLAGDAELDGRRVAWRLSFERGGSAAFVTVFFRALRLARSGVELDAVDPATARAHATFARAAAAGDAADPSCVWAEATPVEDGDGGPAPLATATAVRTGLSRVNAIQ